MTQKTRTLLRIKYVPIPLTCSQIFNNYHTLVKKKCTYGFQDACVHAKDTHLVKNKICPNTTDLFTNISTVYHTLVKTEQGIRLSRRMCGARDTHLIKNKIRPNATDLFISISTAYHTLVKYKRIRLCKTHVYTQMTRT